MNIHTTRFTFVRLHVDLYGMGFVPENKLIHIRFRIGIRASVCPLSVCKNFGVLDKEACSCRCPVGYGGFDCTYSRNYGHVITSTPITYQYYLPAIHNTFPGSRSFVKAVFRKLFAWLVKVINQNNTLCITVNFNFV